MANITKSPPCVHVFQSTVSECTLVSLLAARKTKILELKETEADTDDSVLNSRLVAYASDQVRCSREGLTAVSMTYIMPWPPLAF